MAADTTPNEGTADDFQAHRKNYDGFINVTKWSSVVVAIITAVVVLIIAS